MADSIQMGKSANEGDADKLVSSENVVTERGLGNQVLQALLQDSGGSSSQGQMVDTDAKRLPFFMIRIPRFSDEKLRTQIQREQQEFDEMTQIRDSIRVAMQKQQATYAELWRKFEDSRVGEKAAHDAFASKCHEIDSIQSMLGEIKNAISIIATGNRHRINHGTNTLKEERLLVCQINQLKQSHEHLSSSLDSQKELEEAFVRQEWMENHIRNLKKDLECCRKGVLQTEDNTKVVKATFGDECRRLRDLQAQFQAANDLCQEAYTRWGSLKKESLEKDQL